MKKLLMSLALVGTFAAMSAKGDSYMYWMVNTTGSDLIFSSADLYVLDGNTKGAWLATVNSLEGGQTTARNGGISVGDYENKSFLVELYNGEGDGAWLSQSIISWDDAFKSGGIYQALNPSGADSVVFSSFAVPEPTSGLLMLIGLCGLALKRKRA